MAGDLGTANGERGDEAGATIGSTVARKTPENDRLERNDGSDAEFSAEYCGYGEFEGDEVLGTQINQASRGKRRRRSALACVRCRRRHVKCPGGRPCAKCAAANIACEYLEPNKKLIVSMKYLQDLQESLAHMKRENVRLQALVTSLQSSGEATVSKGIGGQQDGAPVPPRRVLTPLDLQADGSDIQFSKNTIEKDVQRDLAQSVGGNVEEDEDIVPSFARGGRLVESRTGQRYFVGPSSMTLFGLEIQSLISKYLPKDTADRTSANRMPLPSKEGHNSLGETYEPVDQVLQEEGNAYRIVLAKNDDNEDLSVNFTLPSYSYAMFLVDTFITYNDGCFYFFNEGIVKHGLKIAYEGKPLYDDHTLQTIWFCKVLLVFAIGEMYLGTHNNVNGNKAVLKGSAKLPGSGFFDDASEIFSCLFSSGKVENITKEGGIEVMLLYAFYLQVADCTVASYFYFGQALKASLIVGMHVDAQRESLTRYELEHRRRLWWTVYMFERMLSCKAGLPLSFMDETISTELPDDFDMSNPPSGSEHYIFPEAEYIINCVKIVQINAQILNKLYQRQPSSNILPTLKHIVKQLLEWRNNLSSFLQVDFRQKDLKISRLCTNMFTEYFQGLNLAIRPLLFHFTSIQLKKYKESQTYINLQNYSSAISALLNCSLQASLNTIRSLWALMDQNMVALFGYMDREYLFTSCCTLVLFNATFGIHENTYEHLDHALEIFTKMRNLGNNPAGLRRAQLLTLVANLDFHGIFKDLIEKHNDSLKPDSQFDAHDYKDINFVSHTSTDTSALSDIINATLSGSVTNLTKSETRIAEENKSQLNPADVIDNGDLQKILDKMNKLSQTDCELWKDISDQAMWLGSAINPCETATSEADLSAYLGRIS
ncbi:hypothetical protein HG536_0G00300 [Torulaspora globosa]|uniref:Zn(2)-C6 fungal-type domain-containing protein n=1 Tax=Torulaspora globosa TaxID=48254 RepID=A0A7G3ZKY7_9SACH|nr:uncharacterized protein HG536_0G00300 [Torulaspora globosa]QLL34173.1 hypothetical protein HG536_0G00300 [Torulaspora globosa]